MGLEATLGHANLVSVEFLPPPASFKTQEDKPSPSGTLSSLIPSMLRSWNTATGILHERERSLRQIHREGKKICDVLRSVAKMTVRSGLSFPNETQSDTQGFPVIIRIPRTIRKLTNDTSSVSTVTIPGRAEMFCRPMRAV